VQPTSFVDLAVIARLFEYERVGMKTMSAHFGAAVVKSKHTQLRRVFFLHDAQCS
jgi:hypothetical protein